MSKVVSDPSKLPSSSDKAEILKQVEFYFSDENLPTDKFLWRLSQSNDGWVDIATIHSFKRMRRFQPEELVVEALKESELLEVSEGKVRRRNAIVEPNQEEKKGAFQRTVYAKGFGAESETTQFDLEKFFEEFGKTRQVRLRRADDGQFKGSVFVEFAELESAEKFLEAKPKFNGEELLLMSKQAYTEMKAAEHGFSSNANGSRRRFNAFKEKRSKQNKAQGKNQGGRQNGRRDRQKTNKRNYDGEENDAKRQKSEGEAEDKSEEPKETKSEETKSEETKSEETKPTAEPAN